MPNRGNWLLTNLFWQLQVASVHIGAVMGAGFASGQELLQFFVRYGQKGSSAVILAAILFSFFGPLVLFLCKRQGIDRYEQLLHHLFGRKIGRVMDILTVVSMFIGLSVMLSGAGALVAQQWGISPWFGSALTAAAVLVALWTGVGGLVWANTLLIPLKSVICVSVALGVLYWQPFFGMPDVGVRQAFEDIRYMVMEPALPAFSPPKIEILDQSSSNSPTPTLSAILYVSFNMGSVMVVLVALSPAVRRRGGLIGAALGGGMLGLFAILLTMALARYYPEVTGFQVPMLHLAGKLHPLAAQFYAVLLWMAMFTAAIGSAYGAAARLVPGGQKGFVPILTLILLASMPVALLPFSSLVSALYPLFGYLGLPLLAGLIWGLMREIWGTAKKVPTLR